MIVFNICQVYNSTLDSKQKQKAISYLLSSIQVIFRTLCSQMLLHTHLPNLHHHSPPKSPQKCLPNKPPPMLPLFQPSKELRTLSTEYTHSRQSVTKAEKSLSSLSNAQISIKVRQHKLPAQSSLSQQGSSLQMKLLQNPQVFHSKAKNFRDKQKQKKRNVAPYFFKIHNSLKILQAEDQLNRKKHLARLQQQKLKTIQLQQSKKKLSKKLLPHSSQTTISIPVTLPQPNLSSILQTKRAEVTKKAIDGDYSFNLFNSGQIFEQIALINQKRHLVTQPDCRVTAYERLDRFSGKNVVKKKENLFKQEYNMFLKAKLPPSFGQHSTNPDIYEEFVEKTRLSNLQNVKSKLVQGKYLPSQPQKPFSSEFIFGNEIRVVSSKKIQLQNMYEQAKQAEQKARLQQKSLKIMKNASTVQTSKAVTEFNTKRNTLRENQSLMSKVKLKKLAKQAHKEKLSQSVKTEPSINLNGRMKTQPHISSGKKGRDRAYSIVNNVTEQQMQKFITKAGNILGQHFLQQSNLPSQSAISLSPKKVTSKSIELNEFESKHLQNIDRLLRKQESILKREKEDLDSYPWRCTIQVQRKRPH